MQEELPGLPASIARRRQQLYDALREVGAPGSWEHLLRQRGMFSYSGLTRVSACIGLSPVLLVPTPSAPSPSLHLSPTGLQAQCKLLMERWHVYLTLDGRISFTGLRHGCYLYVAAAIKDAVESCPA